MNDGEQEHAHSWLLADDNRVFFFTVSSLALAVASLLLWRAKHVDNLPVNDRPDSQSAHSVLTAALSTLQLSGRPPGEYDMTVSQQQSIAESSTSSNAEQKHSRSKERRRRGKVPYKELLKGGKKTKVAPKLPVHQDNDHGDSLALEMTPKPMTSDDNAAPPTSRQPSPTLDGREDNVLSHLSSELPATGEFHEELHPLPACMAASLSEPAPDSQQNTITSHHATIRPSRLVHAPSLDSTQPTNSPCHQDDPALSIPESFTPSSCSEDHDTHGESPSTSLYASTSTHTSDSDRKLQAYMPSPRTKPPRFMSKQRGSDHSNGNHAVSKAISGNVLLSLSTASNHVSSRTTPSTSASASSSSLHQNSELNISVSPSPCGSPTKPDSSPTLPHVTFPTLNPLQASANDHTHTHPNTTESLSLNGKRPATPPIQIFSRCPTPPPGVSAHIGRIDSPAGPLSAQTQLASMRGALEAARLREEKARADAECIVKENEELKWRWNEDMMAWRRREGELQAQIHHLMQQLQATYSVLATLQTQTQASASFSSPSSPRSHPHSPNLSHNGTPQNFNYIPPSHVQSLLASSYHPYSNYPGSYGGGVSPLFFSGLGTPTSRGSSVANGNTGRRTTGHYTPDASSSVGSSPSRGRRRRRTSESSSTKENNGQDINEAEEEHRENLWENSILADAILKRPESLRMTSSRGSLRSDGRMSALGCVTGIKEDALRVPSRMSERSDISAGKGSDGMSLSSGTGEDEGSETVEDNSILSGAVTGAASDGQEFL